LPYKDLEKGRAHQREYYKRPEVKERIRQYGKEYIQRPGVKQRIRQYVKEHTKLPEVKERNRERGKEYSYIVKNQVLSHYSKKLSNSDIPCCNCCGEHDFLIFLTIDHITNRKNVTHAKRLGGQKMYHYLRKNGYPLGYQVLCANCNSAKSDSGICPHKRSNK